LILHLSTTVPSLLIFPPINQTSSALPHHYCLWNICVV